MIQVLQFSFCDGIEPEIGSAVPEPSLLPPPKRKVTLKLETGNGSLGGHNPRFPPVRRTSLNIDTVNGSPLDHELPPNL